MGADIEELKKKIAPIARQYGVKSVYLFGSMARGDAGPDSDYDFYVIVDDAVLDTHDLASEIYLKIGNNFSRSMDIVVRRASNFAKRSQQLATVEYNVAREGVLLYA